MLLAYSEESPSGLVWVESRGSARAGNVAGSFDTSCGYWRVGKQDRLLTHRVVWELLKGPIPEGFIVDHEDGDTSNNKIGNLRCLLPVHNSQNKAMQHDNTSGSTGVHYDSTNRRWVASWYDNGKRCSKSFSIAKFSESARVFAGQYRDLKLAELNSKGSAYTSRHGI